jgi:hypothetical protein
MSSRRPPPHDPDFPASVSPLPAWRAKAACLDEDPELFSLPARLVQRWSRLRQLKQCASAVPSSPNVCNGH